MAMAEEVGFEPTVDFHLRWFSRPVHSTALPLLRQVRTSIVVGVILKSPKSRSKTATSRAGLSRNLPPAWPFTLRAIY